MVVYVLDTRLWLCVYDFAYIFASISFCSVKRAQKDVVTVETEAQFFAYLIDAAQIEMFHSKDIYYYSRQNDGNNPPVGRFRETYGERQTENSST